MRVMVTMTVEADVPIIDDNMPDYVIEDLFHGEAKIMEWEWTFKKVEE